MASYNNNSNNLNDNPFEDSSESGYTQSRFDYSTQQHQQPHQVQNQDLIDLQQNRSFQSQQQTTTTTTTTTSFSNSTSSSTLNPQQPAYTHQGQQQIKRNDSSFAVDEGKEKKKGPEGEIKKILL